MVALWLFNLNGVFFLQFNASKTCRTYDVMYEA